MSIKILLADDSITIQKVVGIIFGGDDYSLTVVDNGKAAVEKAQEINPDVLLIDALMPGMSGYEVCEAVRAIPSLATKPIILLTGTFEKFDENKAKSCGADDSMAKPFESQQIITKVREMVELGASRSSAPIMPAAAPVVEAAPAPSASSGDIWDAFTPEEPAVQSAADPAVETSSAFDMLQEVPEMEMTSPALDAADENTGSKWIPAEEETFDFPDETAAELSPAAFEIPSSPVEETIAFESTFEAPVEESSATETEFSEPETETAVFEPAFSEPAEEPAAFTPVFEEPAAAPEFSETEVAVAAPPSVAVPVSERVDAAVPAEVTEDQLRAAIAGASREVIERIVWEVVPDLAEVLIKEAIQKIKQGV